MRKVIATINMTLDGFCDHTLAVADDELHEHFNDVLKQSGILLYGRKTYQLMEDTWPAIVKEPTGNPATDEFAVLIDSVPKLVFSRTLKRLEWRLSTLATRSLEDEVAELKKQEGKPVLVGSPSLFAALTQLKLIDEYQLCIHPVIAGSGLILFRNITDKTLLRLLKTKTFRSGTLVVYYEPIWK